MDAQVFGVPDRKYGEEIAVWIQLHEGVELSEDEIRAFCKGKIAHYKTPRYIKFVDKYPMTDVSIVELGLQEDAGIETA